ncbi:2'-deoxynucleoside 5'-phosphate N-hydrolase 1-like isoform X2 [Mercenaria mercenaria]|nr:2'-deoxynucleoside 5'-phosphate N-hydrolase 1-like isoform X2 [Mercenaria mercenaria]XP_053404177.1 2'-deoxynucleoside 5'-phosphate N-hydrolase 1-like isoform X2 [Mercenaria mercenaria]
MKIYFCGSIRGGRQDAELYTRLIEQLKAYGTVLTEHVGTKELTEEQQKWTEKECHDNSLQWLTSCDVVVAEVTQPSHGVGYEIGRAVAMNKKILCLFRPSSDKGISSMILGADNGSTVQVKNYREEDAAKIFKDFLS